ncbi:MAG: amino acid ABC transporter substrate-binding protein [Halanaerobiales bacterium]|nr:amino acid ABC transporter substrate-binding protein [Halanaerobiales bacterium]
MLKKITVVIMVVLILSIMLVGCGKKAEIDSLSLIKEKGKFIVGLDDSFPPMGFRDEKGEIVGFDIDLAKEVAKRMGIEVEFKPVDWDGILFSLKNNDIDLIWNGLTITEKRKKEIAFSEVYLQNRQIIVVGKNGSVQNKEDLKGRVIGLQLGSSSEIALNSESEVVTSLKEIRKYSNNTEALMDLQAGRVDAVVLDEIVGRYYMAKRPDVYRVLEEDFGKESYGVGIRKDDMSFKEELNKILIEMKADGTAEKISIKWFGENILSN